MWSLELFCLAKSPLWGPPYRGSILSSLQSPAYFRFLLPLCISPGPGLLQADLIFAVLDTISITLIMCALNVSRAIMWLISLPREDISYSFTSLAASLNPFAILFGILSGFRSSVLKTDEAYCCDWICSLGDAIDWGKNHGSVSKSGKTTAWNSNQREWNPHHDTREDAELHHLRHHSTTGCIASILVCLGLTSYGRSQAYSVFPLDFSIAGCKTV